LESPPWSWRPRVGRPAPGSMSVVRPTVRPSDPRHEDSACPCAPTSHPGLRRPQGREQQLDPLRVEEQQPHVLVGNPPFDDQPFDRALDGDLALDVYRHEPQGDLGPPIHKSLVGAQAYDQYIDWDDQAGLPRQDRAVGGCEGFIQEEPPVPIHWEDLGCMFRLRGGSPDSARMRRIGLGLKHAVVIES
jgi:hypothetical protein